MKRIFPGILEMVPFFRQSVALQVLSTFSLRQSETINIVARKCGFWIFNWFFVWFTGSAACEFINWYFLPRHIYLGLSTQRKEYPAWLGFSYLKNKYYWKDEKENDIHCTTLSYFKQFSWHLLAQQVQLWYTAIIQMYSRRVSTYFSSSFDPKAPSFYSTTELK